MIDNDDLDSVRKVVIKADVLRREVSQRITKLCSAAADVAGVGVIHVGDHVLQNGLEGWTVKVESVLQPLRRAPVSVLCDIVRELDSALFLLLDDARAKAAADIAALAKVVI